MKLVKNGEMGMLVDDQTIDKLTTLKAIDDEAERITLGDFDVVTRNNNNVVSPEEYYAYLKNLRKTFLEKTKVKTAAKITHPSEKTDSSQDASATSSTSETEKPIVKPIIEPKNDMELQLRERDELIGRLLTAAKSATNEVHKLKADKNISTKEPYLTCQLTDDDHATNASIKGPLSHLLHELSGERKISMFANIAIARGLFGDERAAQISDDLYGKDTFATFIDVVKGDLTANDNDTSAKPEPSKSDAE